MKALSLLIAVIAVLGVGYVAVAMPSQGELMTTHAAH